MLPPSVQVFERGWLSSNNILLTGRLHSDHCGGIAIPAATCAKVDAWNEDALGFRAAAQQCPRFP